MIQGAFCHRSSISMGKGSFLDSSLGGQVASFATTSFGLLWIAFVYIAVAGARCGGDDAGTLSICEGLKSDPTLALVLGIVFSVLFFLMWLPFAATLFCNTCGGVEDSETWRGATVGMCSLLMFVVGIPLLIVVLVGYQYVPDIPTEWCEAQCTITGGISQTLAGGCDGREEYDPTYGKVCVARSSGDSGTWSESQCRDIYEVTISERAATASCDTVLPSQLVGAAAVGHANQWVSCFGSGNPLQVTAFNLRREYVEGGTFPCIFPGGEVEKYGSFDGAEWSNLSVTTDFALLGYCFSEEHRGEECYDKYLRLLDSYEFMVSFAASMMGIGAFLIVMLWLPPLTKCIYKSILLRCIYGSEDDDEADDDCRKDSICCFMLYFSCCCLCPARIKAACGFCLPEEDRYSV